MNRYNRILVSLNLTDLDPTIIRYTNMIVKLTQPDRVDLVNVVNMRGLPAGVVADYPALVDAAAQSNEKTIRELVGEHLHPPKSCEVQVHVFRGTPTEELIRHAKSEDIDLLIVGRDPKSDRSGTLPERLAREAPCSVIVVPKGSEPTISSILVPVDFSEHSATAVERAMAIGKAAKVDAVSCLHVYDVPGYYKKTGKSYDEFAEIMKKNAETSWRKFSSELGVGGLELIPIIRRAAFATQAIKDQVAQAGHDLVVIGARGRGAEKNLMLGGVSQRVINSTHAPLLAVKSKRESTSFLAALLELFGKPA